MTLHGIELWLGWGLVGILLSAAFQGARPGNAGK